MDLNELAIRVIGALLVKRGLCRSRAHDRIGRLAEDGAAAAGCDDDRVGGKGADFHVPQVHGADAAGYAASIEHGGQKFPVLVFFYFAFRFVPADLLVKCVEKLLTGGGSGKGGAVVEGASEAPEIEQTFRRSIEGNTHPIEQIDDAGRGLAHCLDGRLIGQEIATVNCVVEVLVCGVAFTF